MDRRLLGRTGISVSRVLLGCGSIGGIGSSPAGKGKGLSRVEGLEQIDMAVELGVNTLDTANSYAGGVSERVVGEWIALHPAADVLVATKVGNLVDSRQVAPDLSPAHISVQLAESLRRLGRVDLYLAHTPDPTTPIEQTLETFTAAVESGQVRAIGACNLSAAELEAALDAADRLGLVGYQWIQNGYNLLDREDEADLLGMVRDQGLGYTPYSPLAGGVLAGRYERGLPAPARSRMGILTGAAPELDDSTWRGLTGLQEAARVREVSMAALALAWVLSVPEVTAPLVAPRSPDQFADVEEALRIDLSADERAELTALFK